MFLTAVMYRPLPALKSTLRALLSSGTSLYNGYIEDEN